MKLEENHVPTKYRGVKITSGFVITAGVLLVFVLLMLILMRAGIVALPSFLPGLFGNNEHQEQTLTGEDSVLPEFASDVTESKNHYYSFSVDPRETLSLLTEWDSYVREFRVINWYGQEADSRKYTLTVKGDRFRLESDNKVVICDGSSTWTIAETYRTSLENTVFTPESEIGITSLAAVKEAADKGSVTYSSEDGKHLLIVSEDAESGVLTEYLVSIETGVVMSERSYVSGTQYRAVITDRVDVFAADKLSEEYFAVPMAP